MIDYLKQQFILEMKRWYDDSRHEDAYRQLANYLQSKNIDCGYLLTFDFRKKGDDLFAQKPMDRLRRQTHLRRRTPGGIKHATLKYFKASTKSMESHRLDAQKQLLYYNHSTIMKDSNDLKKAVILFIGKNQYEQFEN